MGPKVSKILQQIPTAARISRLPDWRKPRPYLCHILKLELINSIRRTSITGFLCQLAMVTILDMNKQLGHANLTTEIARLEITPIPIYLSFPSFVGKCRE